MPRRARIIVALASMLMAACGGNPVVQEAALRPLWLNIEPAESGYALRVEQEAVARDELDAALLRHAMAANPQLSAEEARREVRIFVRGHPGMSVSASVSAFEELMPVLERFGKVGVVAEDRVD
ncbi:MAG TPA: hypothetical protein PKY87_14745 [Terricaulis sp.]|nr:hypothetical protein [Terricaulis sp.]